MQPTILALLAAPSTRSPPKYIAKVLRLGLMPRSYASPTSELFGTISTATTLLATSFLPTQQIPARPMIRLNTHPSPNYGVWGANESISGNMSGNLDLRLANVLDALAIRLAEMVKVS